MNHGADSMWPIKGREAHSTLFETTMFRSFTKDVPGERVLSLLFRLGVQHIPREHAVPRRKGRPAACGTTWARQQR